MKRPADAVIYSTLSAPLPARGVAWNLRLFFCLLLIGAAAWQGLRLPAPRQNQRVYRFAEGVFRADFEGGSIGGVTQEAQGSWRVQPARDFPTANVMQDWFFFRFAPRAARGLYRLRIGPLSPDERRLAPCWRSERQRTFSFFRHFSVETNSNKHFLVFDVPYSRERDGAFLEVSADRPVSPYALSDLFDAIPATARPRDRIELLFDPLPAVRLQRGCSSDSVTIFLGRIRPQDNVSAHILQALSIELMQEDKEATPDTRCRAVWIIPAIEPTSALSGRALYTPQGSDLSSFRTLAAHSLFRGDFSPVVKMLHRIRDERPVKSLILIEGSRDVESPVAHGSTALFSQASLPRMNATRGGAARYFCTAAGAHNCLHVIVPAQLGLDIAEVQGAATVTDRSSAAVSVLVRRLVSALDTGKHNL